MNKTNAKFLPVKGGDWLPSYIDYVKNIPMLTDAEEAGLIERVKKFKDRDAAEKIITAHLRMVVSTAYEMQSYGTLSMQDMIAEGTIGLLKALDKFDPAKGVRFSVYASYWIRAELYSLVWDNWSSVKVGENPNRKKIFFNLGKARRALGVSDQKMDDANIKKVADYLGVPAKEVELMNARMTRDMSLNVPMKGDEDGAEFQDRLPSKAEDIHDVLEKKEFAVKGVALLQKHLGELPERDRDIIKRRRLAERPATLDELAKEYGISKERVRQIENRAFEVLKRGVLTDVEKSKLGFSKSAYISD
ncbi:MAG: RNA polymerase factor sigma-32 [Rickettsiales bacterium]|jgi:RNA polymerase sigma-32 factor|nr:RNA polymerase factor sigma-32 [Rickettsiales bacterium]